MYSSPLVHFGKKNKISKRLSLATISKKKRQLVKSASYLLAFRTNKNA